MDSEIRWDDPAKESFLAIKKALGETPVLTSSNYTKGIMIFPFASGHTIIVVLLHKNDEGYEQLISSFSKAFRDAELE